MSQSATLQTDLTSYGDGDDFTAMIYETNATSPLVIQTQYPFATGEQTLTKPTGAQKLILRNVTGVIHLIGATGELGYVISTTLSTQLPIAGGTIMFNAEAGALGDLLWM